jgi:aminoglycoside phosphotransferase (APT) family kinase protein
MTEAQAIKKLKQVIQTIEPHSKLLRTWELKEGLSTRMLALELERPDGHTKKMLVRQYSDVDLTRNQHVAADEFKLLQLLQSVGVAAPVPYYLDQSGEIFSRPYLIIEYIEGETEFAPPVGTDFIVQIATHLSRLHAVDCSHLDLSFLPQQAKSIAEKLRARPTNILESGDECQIRDVLEAVWPLPQRNPSVLLHGDFWPGNILWKDGQLVAVIDWENAALGDPLADVANMRREMLWALGRDGMRHFTRQYQALITIDLTHLPYWDLCAALRTTSQLAVWETDDSTTTTMREGHTWFISQAFEKVSLQ